MVVSDICIMIDGFTIALVTSNLDKSGQGRKCDSGPDTKMGTVVPNFVRNRDAC